jgi:RNA polymerase sigma-70 factor (ECF subfamily)
MTRQMATPTELHEQFLRLFTTSEGALRAFVRSLVPTVADANEVMQEVALVLWQKFGEYGLGEDFRRWAFGVAKFKVLAWQRDRKRDRHWFGDDLLEILAQDAAHRSDLLSAQREALHHCLAKLKPAERSLVDTAYSPGPSLEAYARTQGRTVAAIYKQLHRIRMALMKCTRAVLAAEGMG